MFCLDERGTLIVRAHFFRPEPVELSGPVAVAVAGAMTGAVAVKVCVLCERGRFFGVKESVSRRRNAIFETMQSLPKLHATKNRGFTRTGRLFFLLT